LIWTVIQTDNPKTAKSAKIRRNPPKTEKHQKQIQKKSKKKTRRRYFFNTYDTNETFYLLPPEIFLGEKEGG